MKRVLLAWVEQVIVFDTETALVSYLTRLECKGIRYKLVNRDGLKIRIRKSYGGGYNFPENDI